jgi:hypothetical protein
MQYLTFGVSPNLETEFLGKNPNPGPFTEVLRDIGGFI